MRNREITCNDRQGKIICESKGDEYLLEITGKVPELTIAKEKTGLLSLPTFRMDYLLFGLA